MSDRYEIQEISGMRQIVDLQDGRALAAKSIVIRLNQIARLKEKVREVYKSLENTIKDDCG